MTSTIAETVHNGVDTADFFDTMDPIGPMVPIQTRAGIGATDAVQATPRAAWFQFRAGNEWVSGTHSRGTIHDYYGAGEERSHERSFHFDADHPALLVGRDKGPTPVEYVLHALAACLTAGLASLAAAQGITLTDVRSTVSGDIDLNSILGLTPEARNACQHVSIYFAVKGDAPAAKLRQLVAQSKAHSAVYDILTNRVPITIEVETD
jgi:uncharacterized OsmC-like protein